MRCQAVPGRSGNETEPTTGVYLHEPMQHEPVPSKGRYLDMANHRCVFHYGYVTVASWTWPR